MKNYLKILFLFFILNACLIFSQQNLFPTTLKRGPAIHFVNSASQPNLVSPNAITISWWTDDGSDSIIEYGKTSSYEIGKVAGLSKSSFTFTLEQGVGVQHWVNLSNLQPHTKYYYRIKSNGKNLAPLDEEKENYYFITPKDHNTTSFSFIALGDTADGNPDQEKICETIDRFHKDAEFILILGDVVYEKSTDTEYGEKYYPLNYYGRLIRHKPVIPTLGNHEERDRTPDQQVYRTHHFLPTNGAKADERTFYFTYGNGAFFCLDSNLRKEPIYNPSGLHYEWLKKVLNKEDKTWKFVFFHHPMFGVGTEKTRYCEDGTCSQGPCSGQKICDNNVEWRKELIPLFVQNKVNLILTGHDHNYQRTYKTNTATDEGATPFRDEENGIVHIVSGAGGTTLRNIWMNPLPDWSASRNGEIHSFSKIIVNKNVLEFYQYDKNNIILDSFTLDLKANKRTKKQK